MKTPLLHCALTRLLPAILALGPFAILPARADLQLQLPIARASHSFTLWELYPLYPGEDQIPIEGWPALGMAAGVYTSYPIVPMGLVGGTFSSDGVWHPGGAPFLSATVTGNFPQASYFVMDNDTGEAVQPNRADLVAATWLSLSNSVPAMFFAIPAGRESDVFGLYDGLNGWFPVSNGQVQRWVEDGVELSLGYFEAWAFVPSDLGSWGLYDITTGEIRWGSATQWVPAGGLSPTAEARFYLPYDGETFSYYVGDAGGTTAGSVVSGSDQDNPTSVAFSVGIGKEFRIVRVRNNAGGVPTEGAQSFTYTMPWGGMSIGGEWSRFADGGAGSEDWRDLYFRAQSTSGLKVKRVLDGAVTPIQWDASANSTFVSDPSDPTGTTGTLVEWYGGWATVDVRGGWTVMAGAADYGQGPDYISWPYVTAGGGRAEVVLPSGRYGHALRSSYGGSVSYSYSYDIPMSDPLFGDYTVPVDVCTVEIPASMEPSGGSLAIIDDTTGESSQAFPVSNGTMSLDLINWHLPQHLLLKVSATRWGNSIQVRSAGGRVSKIRRHQIQGDWSWSPGGGGSWFNSYGFFDADGDAFVGIPWDVYDATRGEVLHSASSDGIDFSASVDNTDTDGDGLKDWYERMIGTNPLAKNTDNDMEGNDYEELENGTNPRAASVNGNSNATLSVFTLLEK